MASHSPFIGLHLVQYWFSLRIGLKEVSVLCTEFVVTKKLATVGDLDVFERFVAGTLLDLLGLLADVVAMDDSSIDRVLVVQVRSVLVADEELGAVRVGSRVRHRQDTLVRVGIPDLLVGEPLTVDAQASRTVAISSVASLHHEVRDDAMEAVALVVHRWALFTRAQGSEVLTSLGHIGKEFKDNSA